MYLTPDQAHLKYGYHVKTLADWADAGKIQFIRSKGGHRRYLESDLSGLKPEAEGPRAIIFYARVSTHSQKEDLQTQAAFLAKGREGELVTDIGSGMNFKRRKFIKLMERVAAKEVGEIVVGHKDRLCRFGFDFVEWFCNLNGCKVTVLGETHLSPYQELMQDFMSIMHCFSSRLYFLRRYKEEVSKEPKKEPKKTLEESIDKPECIGVSL